MSDQANERSLAPEQVAAMSDAQLVDVRTDAEYEASRIQGARHVQLDQLQGAASALDRGQPVVFYCRTGERSRMALDAFTASGWDAYDISGGLVAWAENGLPLEPAGADVATHSSIPSD
jgi:rhodanese-related sulfurtransferase